MRTPASLDVMTTLDRVAEEQVQVMKSRTEAGAEGVPSVRAAERGGAGVDPAAQCGPWVAEIGSAVAAVARNVTVGAVVTVRSGFRKMRRKQHAETRNAAGAHDLVTANVADLVTASVGEGADLVTAAVALVSVASRRSQMSPWSHRLEMEAWGWEATTTTTMPATRTVTWKTNHGWISATSRSSRNRRMQAILPRCPIWGLLHLPLHHLQKKGRRMSEYQMLFSLI